MGSTLTPLRALAPSVIASQTLEGSRCQRDQSSFGPLRIPGPPSANRHAKARLDLRQQPHRLEVAADGRHFAFAVGTKPEGNLVHVQVRFHLLLRAKLTDREILIANYQTDFPLAGISAHRPAEAPEFGQVSGILNVCGRRVAMDNDGFVLHERSVSFIITPDALRFRVGGRPSEHTPEHLQSSINPIPLDRSRSITLDARDEQDNQDTLAPALQKRSPPDGLLAPLRHVSINIDR